MDGSPCRRRFIAGLCSAASSVAVAGCGNDGNGNSTPGSSPPDTTGDGAGATATASPSPTSSPTETATATATPRPSPTPTSTIEPVDVEGHVRPAADPDVVPEELVCGDEEFERRTGWIGADALQWGDLTDGEGNRIFALRVDSLSVERGEEVTFTLTNVSASARETGNVYKANFDAFTDAGWQDPRGWPDGIPKPITDDVWEFDPGEQFRLTVEMSPKGVVDGAFPGNAKDLDVCPGLPAGRYRFATAAPDPGDVAVAFDLTE